MKAWRNAHVLRYRKVVDVRGREWEPIGSAWQTTAQNGLVAHDLFHHLPDDTGTLGEEIATLGTEYFVEFDGSQANEIEPPGLNALSISAGDIVGAVLDANRGRPPALMLEPVRTPRLFDELEDLFAMIASAAHRVLRDEVPDGPQWESVVSAYANPEPFVSWMRLGYRHARRRYPNPLLVRQEVRRLMAELRMLDDESAPVGTVITLSRRGSKYKLDVERPAAPQAFPEDGMTVGFMMSWSGPVGRSTEGISLHFEPDEFERYVEETQAAGSFYDTRAGDYVLPDGDASRLSRVLIAEPALGERVRQEGTLRLKGEAVPPTYRMPCGALVLGDGPHSAQGWRVTHPY